MKNSLIVCLLLICWIPKVSCQTTLDDSLKSDTIRTEFTDYVLSLNILDTAFNCQCKDMQILNPLIQKKYGSSAKFVKIEIVGLFKDFSYDTINIDTIQKIKLLLVPVSLELPLDTTILVLLHRAYSYDYLEFDRIVSENTVFYHSSCYAGNGGLYLSVKKPSWFGLLLWRCHLIDYNKIAKGKSRNQKNILHCIKTIQKTFN